MPTMLQELFSLVPMKRIMQRILALGLLVFVLVAGRNAPAANDSGRQGWKLTSDYSLKEPFHPKELRALAENPSKDNRRLMLLILRAGIEKDGRFQYLLKKPKLREQKNVDLALSSYDYMLNHSDSALDHLLARLATEEVGADSDAIVVLQPLDEWDRSIRAFRKHFTHADGAGAACMEGFKTTRAYLFPEKYEQMRKVIEAPSKW